MKRLLTALHLTLFLSGLVMLITGCQKEYIQKQDQLSSSQKQDQLGSSQTTPASVQSKSVAFTLSMDFSTNPAFGTFTATGALNTSGTAEYDYNPNQNFVTAHNVITLTTNEGTIIIHDECEFTVTPPFPNGRGSWQIVSGTGAYANIKGSGQETILNDGDILTGIIY